MILTRANDSQVVTAYSPVLLSQAGYSTIKQNGLAGGLNTVGIIGTIISANIVDRIGRRNCLMGGSAALFICNFIVSSPPHDLSVYCRSLMDCHRLGQFMSLPSPIPRCGPSTHL